MSVRMSVRRGPRQVTVGRAEACPVCRQARAAGRTLCTDCCLDVERMLDPAWLGDRDERIPASIPVLWSELDPTPGVSDPSGRSAPGFRSTPPLNVDVVVLRDRRSQPDPVEPVWYLPNALGYDDWSRPQLEPTGQPRAIEWAIAGLAEAVREGIGLHEPWPQLASGALFGDAPAVGEHCAWMLEHLRDLTARTDAGAIYEDLSTLVADLRGPAGDPPDDPIGPCVGLVPIQGQRERVPCEEPLYLPPPQPGQIIPPDKPLFRCPRCDEPYTHRALIRMQLGNELASAQ